MKDPIELVHGAVELSAGEFAGVSSQRDTNDFAGLLPPGEYQLHQDLLSNLEPEQGEGASMGEFAGYLSLLRTEEGGRRSPIPVESWRCVVQIAGEYRDARVYVGESNRLAPGETTVVRLRFLSPEVKRSVQLGEPLEVWERGTVGRFTPFLLV